MHCIGLDFDEHANNPILTHALRRGEQVAGDLDFLCTADFEWAFCSSNCIREEDGSFL
jgi:hypothetical protein